MFSTILDSLFSPTESQTIKQLKKNVTMLIENQNSQQALIGANAKSIKTTKIHIDKNKKHDKWTGRCFEKYKQYSIPLAT